MPRTRVDLLEKISQISLDFLAPLELSQTYQLVVEKGLDLVRGKYGSILLNVHNRLERVYSSAPHFTSTRPRKNGYIYNTFRSGVPLVIGVGELLNYHPELLKLDIKSVFFVPLSYGKKSIGVLTIQSADYIHSSKRESEAIKLFGSMASLAIRKTQLYEETTKALKTRDRFISMAAHELKTPLTTISGYIQLLDTKLTNSTAPEARWVDSLSSETIRLTKLVDELLQVNQIKSGQLKYSWKSCSLREILRRATNAFQFKYPNRLLFFHDMLTSEDDTVAGDFDKLIQVFTNLLDNAVKFSASDTSIKITLSYKSPNFRIEIEDQGHGIPPEELHSIFNEFYKIESGRTEQGMGLGLYLVKNIIDMHQGGIEVFSTVNKGTVVLVELKAIK
jgi:signal transduction histidine kinase